MTKKKNQIRQKQTGVSGEQSSDYQTERIKKGKWSQLYGDG